MYKLVLALGLSFVRAGDEGCENEILIFCALFGAILSLQYQQTSYFSLLNALLYSIFRFLMILFRIFYIRDFWSIFFIGFWWILAFNCTQSIFIYIYKIRKLLNAMNLKTHSIIIILIRLTALNINIWCLTCMFFWQRFILIFL